MRTGGRGAARRCGTAGGAAAGGPEGGPGGLPVVDADLSRRGFVKTLGAAAAAAGLQGCWSPPTERILPYVHQPPEVVPGVPLSYATASLLDGWATGVVVQTREGRPVKVEGNPLHPASLGASGVFEQAALMDLYDPARLRGVSRNGEPAGQAAFRREVLAPAVAGGGEGLALLLEPTTSPLTRDLVRRVREALPRARVHVHSPLGPPPAGEAFRRTAGRPLLPLPRLEAARVVVAMDADFLSAGPFHLRHARGFGRRRSVSSPEGEMSRVYEAGPVPTAVTPVSDHRLRVRAGDVVFVLAELVRALGGRAAGLPPVPGRLDDPGVRAWVAAAASDLSEHLGEGLVLAGDEQPPAAHALAWEANRLLGNAGSTVTLHGSTRLEASDADGDLADLTAAVRQGAVRTLVVLEGNPAWTAPADVDFAGALESVDAAAYLGLRENATARACGWVLPALHAMERWGDGRAFDGTLTPVQPLVRPLYPAARGVDDVLLAVLDAAGAASEALRDGGETVGAGGPTTRVRGLLRGHWREGLGLGPAGADAWEGWWEDALRRGVVEGTASAPEGTPAADPAPLLATVEPPAPDGIEVAVRPDPRVRDGRFAGNAWLQELPDPVTKLTWGNGALLSPATARRLGVEVGEPVSVEVDGRSVEAPALPVPGHADEAVTVTLGYGTRDTPTAAAARGADAYRLRTSARPWHAPGTVEPVGGEAWPLALAQTAWRLHDRPLVLHETLEEYRRHPDFTREHRGDVASLYRPPRVREAESQWGMTIDLSVCTGCSACVVACRAENNVPVVGPEEVSRGRIMDWIRIDRYVTGPMDEPHEHLRQPMLCQHCEKAPCEYVCPVNATVHSADGLNEMVYNRCVGTRFCSNNCPYKVRRFNWVDYNERRRPSEELVLNPDVTVRERGVMEKCTYCVQRIRRAQRQARSEDRPVGADEVVTACQQACPTAAIVFGDLTQPESEVAHTREDPRRYAVLHELGTRPRTLYLARIGNPHPDLARVPVAEP